MVVRFHLEADRPVAVEVDDSRVVFEHRQAPRRRKFPCGPHYRALQEIGDALPFEFEISPESFMDAVLAPGLPQRFHFGVRGISFEAGVERFDGGYFGLVQAVFTAYACKFLVYGTQQVNMLQFECIPGTFREGFRGFVHDSLDYGVDQQPRAYDVQFALFQRAFYVIALGRPGRMNR